jgi:hypothetical protein
MDAPRQPSRRSRGAREHPAHRLDPRVDRRRVLPRRVRVALIGDTSLAMTVIGASVFAFLLFGIGRHLKR